MHNPLPSSLYKRALAVASSLAVLSSLTPALGTTVLKVTTAQMAQTSQWVVRAHVLEVSNSDLRGEGRGLHTDIKLLVTEVYKGVNVPQIYTLQLIGGTGADGSVLRIPGMPEFTAGDQAVLFLERTSRGHIPCGLGQGVWRLIETPNGTWARQSMVGAHLMRRDPAGRLVPAASDTLHDVRPLTDLLDELFAGDSASLPPSSPSVPVARPERTRR